MLVTGLWLLSWVSTPLVVRSSVALRASRVGPTPATMAEGSDGWALERLKAGGVRVAPKDNTFTSTDIETCVPRSAESPGIGIGLEEFGTDGTVGLVLVSFLVEDGNAASASRPILPGDALISVAPAGSAPISLEGLTYDATIEALQSIDPSAGPLTFSLRRLKRVPRVAVRLTFPPEDERPDETLTMIPGMPLRSTMLSKGIKLNDPLARRFDAGYGTGDCGGEGCCCTCALEVVQGAETLNEQKAQERQMLRKKPRWRLACRARIDEGLTEDSELVLKVSPRAWVEELEEACLVEEQEQA